MEIAKFWLSEYLKKSGCGDTLGAAKRNCIISLELRDKNNQLIAPVDHIYPDLLKSVNLPTAKLKVRVSEISSAVANSTTFVDFKIELISNNVALFVWLELSEPNARFSENGFHILEGRKTITLQSAAPVTVEWVVDDLHVTTLSDLYDPNRKLNGTSFVERLKEQRGTE